MKLISLNIERDKHLRDVIPFLRTEAPDVICLQEVLKKDLPLLEKELGMKSIFSELVPLSSEEGLLPWGITILSPHELKDAREEWYYRAKPGATVRLPVFEDENVSRSLLSASLKVDGEIFRVGTTHFTWTPDGEASDAQRTALQKFLELVSGHEEIIFCGDFNAPRGKEIFDALAGHYMDWIPRHYTSSIDGGRHRAGALPYMVDGLFSTPGYQAEKVELRSGVSDHLAIAASISRNKKDPLAGSMPYLESFSGR